MDTYEELENMSLSPEPTPRDTDGIGAWSSSGLNPQQNFFRLTKQTGTLEKLKKFQPPKNTLNKKCPFKTFKAARNTT